MRRRFKFLLVIALIYTPLVWQSTPAMAGEQPVPSRQWTPAHGPDPEGVWRTVTQDDATSTSDCIGDLVTPLCAVDTVMACYARNEGKLCQLAWSYPAPWYEFGSPASPRAYILYRVTAVRTAQVAGTFPFPNDPPRGTDIKVGDLLIDVLWQSCWRPIEGWTTEAFCIPKRAPYTYVLVPIGGRWHIADTSQPEE